MNDNTKKIKNTGFYILMSLLTAIIIALAIGNIMLDREKTWDVEYEMTNRRIEWTGAGYSGR